MLDYVSSRMRIIFALVALAVISGCIGTEPEAAPQTMMASTVSVTSTTQPDIACESIQDPDAADSCLYDRAASSRERRDCHRISYDNLKWKCMANIESDPDYCEKIDVLKEKDWCMWMMAFRLNDISHCAGIFDVQLESRCKHVFVKDKKADPYVCFEIANSTLADDCILHHVGLGRINPKLCYRLAAGEKK